MDQCHEQLIKIRRTKRTVVLYLAIWASMALVAIAAVVFLWSFLPLCFLLVVGAVFVGVRMSRMLTVEYETVFTNGTVDLDVIIGRSDRKRVISFDCRDIVRVEPFRGQQPVGRYGRALMCCNRDEQDAFVLIINQKTGDPACLTLALDKTMRQMMPAYMDKLVAREAFKEPS